MTSPFQCSTLLLLLAIQQNPVIQINLNFLLILSEHLRKHLSLLENTSSILRHTYEREFTAENHCFKVTTISTETTYMKKFQYRHSFLSFFTVTCTDKLFTSRKVPLIGSIVLRSCQNMSRLSKGRFLEENRNHQLG